MSLSNSSTQWGMWFLVLLAAKGLPADEERLISFEMEDQFGATYTENSWQDSVVVLFGSDKEGSQFNKGWALALWDSLEQPQGNIPLTFIALADLRGVPFFLKGLVKGYFPKEKDRPILLDWKGRFPEAYQFTKDACNILIFDRKQQLVYQTHGREPESQKLAAIYSKLKELLADELAHTGGKTKKNHREGTKTPRNAK